MLDASDTLIINMPGSVSSVEFLPGRKHTGCGLQESLYHLLVGVSAGAAGFGVVPISQFPTRLPEF